MDVNDGDEGDDASLTMCNKSDNRNRNDGEDVCASTATTPAHRCCDDTASREIVTRQEAEAVQRDAARQPAVANKEEVSRMDVCGDCAMKGDARQRHATTGNATTSLHTRGKWEERSQQTRGNGASIGQGCVFRGGGKVERMRGGGINETTSRKMRDFCGGGKRERNMVADNIIGALGMENKTIEGRIDKGAV